ncbi:MAG: hypothetical protein K6C94_08095 [Candidatus Gastranaerophilales bacterium]|nr:hypothetical protein [Candidatus Gastranaerophilales bacterium]
MAENLKQKLNRICSKLKNILSLFCISYFCGIKVFAEELGDIPNDEFIQDALQVDVPANAANSAEQNMAAEQVGDEAINSGNNVLHTIKDGLHNALDSMQNLGYTIGEHLEKITGGNPFVTKILVALVLVVISVIVITVLILIAKKFVFKSKAPKNVFQQKKKQPAPSISDDESGDYDEYEEEYSDNGEYPENAQNTSDVEYENDGEFEDEYGDDQYDTSVPDPIPSLNTTRNAAFIDVEPQTVQEAIKRFILITE